MSLRERKNETIRRVEHSRRQVRAHSFSFLNNLSLLSTGTQWVLSAVDFSRTQNAKPRASKSVGISTYCLRVLSRICLKPTSHYLLRKMQHKGKRAKALK
ncbi:MAG: hypothetical protein ACFBZ8_06875 [Opitutales bacterium]